MRYINLVLISQLRSIFHSWKRNQWLDTLKVCFFKQLKVLVIQVMIRFFINKKKSVIGYTRIRDFFSFSILNFFVNEKFSKKYSLFANFFMTEISDSSIFSLKDQVFLVLLTHNLRIYLLLTLDLVSSWVTMCKLNMQNLVIFLHDGTFT